MRITGAGYVGDFPAGGKVILPVRIDADDGTPIEWSAGIVAVVNDSGVATEQGVTWIGSQPMAFNPPTAAPCPGNHMVVVDLADPGAAAFFSAGNDYRVLLFGDAIETAPMQGVCVGQFSVRNR